MVGFSGWLELSQGLSESIIPDLTGPFFFNKGRGRYMGGSSLWCTSQQNVIVILLCIGFCCYGGADRIASCLNSIQITLGPLCLFMAIFRSSSFRRTFNTHPSNQPFFTYLSLSCSIPASLFISVMFFPELSTTFCGY